MNIQRVKWMPVCPVCNEEVEIISWEYGSITIECPNDCGSYSQ